MPLVKHLKKRKRQFIKGMETIAGVGRRSDRTRMGTYEELYPNATPKKKKKKRGK